MNTAVFLWMLRVPCSLLSLTENRVVAFTFSRDSAGNAFEINSFSDALLMIAIPGILVFCIQGVFRPESPKRVLLSHMWFKVYSHIASLDNKQQRRNYRMVLGGGGTLRLFMQNYLDRTLFLVFWTLISGSYWQQGWRRNKAQRQNLCFHYDSRLTSSYVLYNQKTGICDVSALLASLLYPQIIKHTVLYTLPWSMESPCSIYLLKLPLTALRTHWKFNRSSKAKSIASCFIFFQETSSTEANCSY